MCEVCKVIVTTG